MVSWNDIPGLWGYTWEYTIVEDDVSAHARIQTYRRAWGILEAREKIYDLDTSLHNAQLVEQALADWRRAADDCIAHGADPPPPNKLPDKHFALEPRVTTTDPSLITTDPPDPGAN